MSESSLTPVMPPPAGETSSFGGPRTDMQTSLMIINLVTFAIATVFLALRLYTSAFINKRTDVGDFFIVASWGVAIASIVCTFIAIDYGYGKHAWDVSTMEITGYYHKLVAMAVTYFWVPSLTKLSVLVMIHHVYRAKWGRLSTWAIAAAVLIYTTVFTVLIVGPCDPLSGSLQCVNNVGGAHAALNILTDLIVIALPIPLIHTLQMPVRQKISVGILMTLGSFCLVASIGRIVFVVDIQNNPDVTFCQAKVGVWSAIELHVGIMGASLARLKPFVQRYFPKLHFSSHGHSHKHGPSGGGMIYEERKQYRPAREAYLLHSVERNNGSDDEELGKYNGISVQSDILVSRSDVNAAHNAHMVGVAVGGDPWQHTSQVQALGNVYRPS